MIYPKNFENKVGFDIIRGILKENCLSTLGKKYVDKIHFSDNYELINKLLSQAEELKQVIMMDGRFPEQDYFDLTPELARLNVAGTYIELQALFDIKTSLNTISECINVIEKLDRNKYPFLNELIKNVAVEKQVLSRIDKIIDDKGKIKDTASAELQTIRKELLSRQANVEKRINQYFNNLKKQGLVPENESVTIRNGRTVIPVNASNKRKLKGIIQDESASGQTVFIEPDEIIELNNDIRNLEFEERREIIKILKDFTDFLRPQIESLINCYHFLGILDFIRAKAKFAIETESLKPKLQNDTIINWVKVKHPLLYLSHKRRHKTQDTSIKTKDSNIQNSKLQTTITKLQTKEVVANDITLNKKQRILLISGPNAGGKSVLLKTAGLLQYMIQCGLLVPMSENSEAGIFKNLFIDIGDEQSIENDLSTYSSHLLNIKFFINNATKQTLFLIDELGAGTEPQVGGAIAEASLEEINTKKAFGIVTTHYTNLKLLADKTEGIVNCSMLFDAKKLQPSYQLKIGMIGSSYAFEIARKIGFQKAVLLNAEKKTGTKQVDFEKQLLELEAKKKEVESKEIKIKVADEMLTEVVQKYKKLTDEVEKTKKTIINEAKQEAGEILSGSNKLIEKTIKEIREAHADKEKTKKLRETLDREKTKVKIEKSEDSQQSTDQKKSQTKSQVTVNRLQGKRQVITPKKLKKEIIQSPVSNLQSPIRNINKGDYVRAKGKTTIGQVVDVYDNDAIVAFSSFNMGLPLNELEKVEQNTLRSRQTSFSKGIMNDLNAKMKDFKSTIDVRGKRVEEAISLVQKYVDDAILLRIKDVNIIHGKGNGILRQVIREYLHTVEEIKSYKDEKTERGGDGVTCVVFK